MTAWRRPQRCDTSTCPEVLIEPGYVSVRSTLQPDRVVRFTTAEWAALVDGVQRGEFSDSSYETRLSS